MYPLIPLLAAGLTWEIGHFAHLIKTARANPLASQRAAAWVIGGVAVAAVLAAGWMQGFMLFRTLPEMAGENERLLAERAEVYAWINQHVEPSAGILAYNPTLYLYTGRRTASQTLLPIYWYRGDTADTIAAFRDLPAYAAENRLQYLYIRDSEYAKTLGPAEAEEARRALETNPAVRLVFRAKEASVFQTVTPLSSQSR
jgi:hypothetical protein